MGGRVRPEGHHARPIRGSYPRPRRRSLAYVGIAMSEETSPRLHFPNGFDPHSVIFGADRVKEGELYLVRDPIDVLTAHQSGVENVVAFLAPITAQQVEMLAALMDAAHCETVELF